MVQELVLREIHLSDICRRLIKSPTDTDDDEGNTDQVEYRF